MVAAGNANTPDWPSKPIMLITMEPKPYALRRVTWSFGVVATVWAANMRAPLRRMPRRSDSRAGEHTGVVGKEDQWKVERVRHHDEVRGLVGTVGVDGAGEHLGLVRHDRDRLTAEPGERADHRLPEPGLHLEPRPIVEHRVDHLHACRRCDGRRAG